MAFVRVPEIKRLGPVDEATWVQSKDRDRGEAERLLRPLAGCGSCPMQGSAAPAAPPPSIA